MEDLQSRIRQKKFIANNGATLRTINTLRYKYIPLNDLAYGLEPTMSKTELMDCINYLTLRKYITTRKIKTKTESTIADTPFEELEAKLSAEGISLLSGTLVDDNVDV